jgi:metal-responsive CopG/Arc/MetJ family transcriptional regulator
MSVSLIEIPFQADLLQKIDRFVDEKVCSRADIILEATKMYIARKQNWQNIFSLGDSLALENNLSEVDVINEIKASRQEKR